MVDSQSWTKLRTSGSAKKSTESDLSLNSVRRFVSLIIRCGIGVELVQCSDVTEARG